MARVSKESYHFNLQRYLEVTFNSQLLETLFQALNKNAVTWSNLMGTFPWSEKHPHEQPTYKWKHNLSLTIGLTLKHKAMRSCKHNASIKAGYRLNHKHKKQRGRRDRHLNNNSWLLLKYPTPLVAKNRTNNIYYSEWKNYNFT